MTTEDYQMHTLAALRSIDATLTELLALSKARRASKATGDQRLHVDLDGPHGDPIVKAKSPRDWTGEDQTGKRFSECPAEYLDMVADRLDYFAQREADPKKQRYNELDAARARGWAERIRGGYRPDVVTSDEVSW